MATTDFVMPKLGLTMTEGTVARWDVAPGSRFAAGDIILVVETDKIAYDVEAPGPGILQEVLVAEGDVVPVGTPIGRWDVGDIKVSLDAPDIDVRADSPAVAPRVAQAPVVAPAALPQGEGARILATPFARRLARQGGVDLRNLNGSGPRGRIKAADVERATATGRPTIAPPAAAAATDLTRMATHSAGAEIDVTALLALNAQINSDLPDLHADLAHFVVLAATKVRDVFREPPVIGLAQSGEGDATTVSVFASADCRTLSSVVAQAARSAAPFNASLRGALWIEPALPGISFFAAAPPDGWSGALYVGAVRDTFRPDSDGRPVRAALVNVVLTSRAAALDPMSAQRLLRRIRELLETPLLLLAS
jgi:pyruvate dehydrogenase E2 component (dihydrolipoyllysine-residue acetyltransferase)